jgi:hypothetical protein
VNGDGAAERHRELPCRAEIRHGLLPRGV